jgi:MraZ protein
MPGKAQFSKEGAHLRERLCGTYNPSIDAKGRMSFPNKLREILGPEFFLCIGHDKPYIAVYSPEEFDIYCDKLYQIKGEIGSAIRRELLSGADKQTPDKQGRIFIAQHLREYAGIKDDVTVIGNLNRCEIWDTFRFNAEKNVDREAKKAALADLVL